MVISAKEKEKTENECHLGGVTVFQSMVREVFSEMLILEPSPKEGERAKPYRSLGGRLKKE